MSYIHEFNEFEKSIIEGYPKWFSYDEFQFGFEINKGWDHLIKEFCEKLTQMDVPEDYCVNCIKQKFGDLLIYDLNGTEEISKLRNSISDRADHICECCGSTEDVKKTKTGWIETLCIKCRKGN